MNYSLIFISAHELEFTTLLFIFLDSQSKP